MAFIYRIIVIFIRSAECFSCFTRKFHSLKFHRNMGKSTEKYREIEKSKNGEEGGGGVAGRRDFMFQHL